jgi:hypothetical protein
MRGIQAVPRNRERTQEYQRQARHLLMELDPIGVSDTPEAVGEYDCMIGPKASNIPCEGHSRPWFPAGWLVQVAWRCAGLNARDFAEELRRSHLSVQVLGGQAEPRPSRIGTVVAASSVQHDH